MHSEQAPAGAREVRAAVKEANPSVGTVVSRRLRLRLRGPWAPGQWTGPDLRGLIANPVKRYACVWDTRTRTRAI